MVVIGHLMCMALIGMNHINDVFMGMAVIFNLGLMLGHDLCDLGKIMRLALRIRRHTNTRRQSDGYCKAQECECLSYHLPISAGLGPLALSP